MYVFNYGIGAAILRAIISVPGHLSFGIMMGYYMLLAKLSKNKKDYMTIFGNDSSHLFAI